MTHQITINREDAMNRAITALLIVDRNKLTVEVHDLFIRIAEAWISVANALQDRVWVGDLDKVHDL